MSGSYYKHLARRSLVFFPCRSLFVAISRTLLFIAAGQFAAMLSLIIAILAVPGYFAQASFNGISCSWNFPGIVHNCKPICRSASWTDILSFYSLNCIFDAHTIPNCPAMQPNVRPSRGDQFERYGYAACGLAVAPHA